MRSKHDTEPTTSPELPLDCIVELRTLPQQLFAEDNTLPPRKVDASFGRLSGTEIDVETEIAAAPTKKPRSRLLTKNKVHH